MPDRETTYPLAYMKDREAKRRLVAQARAILDHGDDAPSWLAAFALCRAVIELHAEKVDA
jgi:hypothetical protein